ncbi:hypothetical protein [Streptomyces sp. c-19]|uniref:hypothetical protein n=1 Tax=Streptomyces sp. c-19 TaxID=2789275 RepID=UPI00398164DE
MSDQNDAVAEERDAGASSHQAFLQFDVGDAAFVDSGVVRGGDSLRDSVLVFAKGSGKAHKRGQTAGCEVVQPAQEGCRVVVVEHGGEPADQVVSLREFRAVVEESGQAVVDVEVPAVRVSGDPAGCFTR